MFPASQPSYFQPQSWQNQASSYFSNPVYDTANMQNGMLGGNQQQGNSFNWSNAVPGFASGIMGLMGGFNNGSGQMQHYLQQGQNSLQGNYDQGMGYLDPYNQAGTQAIGQYQNYLNQMQNPTQYYNNIMSQYQMSPAAQFQMQQGIQAANRSAAAGGNVGTPAAQKDLMQYAQGLSNQDMQQYFNNQMGINSQYGAGLSGLMGQGFNAADLMNQNRMGLGNQMADMYTNMGLAGMYGQQARGFGGGLGIGGLLGGLFSGGLF